VWLATPLLAVVELVEAMPEVQCQECKTQSLSLLGLLGLVVQLREVMGVQEGLLMPHKER
jgi:hypothetical protein